MRLTGKNVIRICSTLRECYLSLDRKESLKQQQIHPDHPQKSTAKRRLKGNPLCFNPTNDLSTNPPVQPKSLSYMSQLSYYWIPQSLTFPPSAYLIEPITLPLQFLHCYPLANILPSSTSILRFKLSIHQLPCTSNKASHI